MSGMTDGPKTLRDHDGVPLLVWGADQVERGAIDQALKATRLPFIFDHVSLMPDAHFGYGVPIGFVGATEGAIVPSLVGSDIGCGIIGRRLNVTGESLIGKESWTDEDVKEILAPIHPLLVQVIPTGMGAGRADPRRGEEWIAAQQHVPPMLGEEGHKHDPRKTAAAQFGSLGASNHYLEVCLDQSGHLWVVLHSGSRGVGKRLADRHIDAAKTNLAHLIETGALEDPDLAYVVEGTPEFQAYIADMLWAQDYAFWSRDLMMEQTLSVVRGFLESHVPTSGEWKILDSLNCHHNFAAKERHFDKDLWVTRKGAVRARPGDRGIIPGSMATGSYITTGLGNPESFMSSSHGAGRVLGRNEAKRRFTVEDMKESMKGIAWDDTHAAELIDEIPYAYKDIDAVMEAQSDLVRIDHRLRPIINLKGTK